MAYALGTALGAPVPRAKRVSWAHTLPSNRRKMAATRSRRSEWLFVPLHISTFAPMCRNLHSGLFC